MTTLGLIPAVQALAARSAVPVELEEDLGERLPPGETRLRARVPLNGVA